MIGVGVVLAVVAGVCLAGLVDRLDRRFPTVGAGGASSEARPSSPHRASAGTGSPCTCDPLFFPTACDVDCPTHGLAIFLRERLEADAGFSLADGDAA